MTTRRIVGLAVVAVLATSIALGSGGFSSVGAERTVEVAVVEPENAYIGVAACAKTTNESNGDPVHVWVTNRYSEPITVASLVGDDSETYEPNANPTLTPGESERYEANFATEQVTVHVAGNGLEATVTVRVQSKSACSNSLPATATNATS